MKAETVKLSTIFGARTRYRVPLFQRPYVWQRERQWEPLWSDLQEIADRQIDSNKSNDGISHFMGAIVVDQEVQAGGPTTRLVIDGQQRLTTLQLIIAAARVVAIERGDPQTVQKLESMLFLPDFLIEDDPSHRLVLVPTNYDRAAFEAAVEHDGHLDKPLAKQHSTQILTAYAYFREAITEWVGQADNASPAEKLRSLATTLWDLLRLVQIALERGDDAQAIFETMNARGTPLLAADLVKNYLFRGIEAQRGAQAAAKAYGEHWERFDQRYWRQPIGRGRIRRPRIDIVLTYWLTLQTIDEVGFQTMYETFVRHARSSDPYALLDSLDSTSAVYEGFDELEPLETEGTFFHRVDVMETTTFMPVAIWMFGEAGIADAADRARGLKAIESWLVRRMLCRMTTKNYNSVALALLKRLTGSNAPSSQDVVEFLSQLEGESQVWPDDDAVKEAVRTSPYYAVLTRRRLRMVLDAIEASMHDARVGKYVDRDTLTIEHVLPQAWEANWPLPALVDELAGRIGRDAAKHRIGNLALVTQALNSTLSNAPWVSLDDGPSKSEALKKYSQYMINKDVIDQPSWDESRIQQRGEVMSAAILRIWPKPPA